VESKLLPFEIFYKRQLSMSSIMVSYQLNPNIFRSKPRFNDNTNISTIWKDTGYEDYGLKEIITNESLTSACISYKCQNIIFTTQTNHK